MYRLMYLVIIVAFSALSPSHSWAQDEKPVLSQELDAVAKGMEELDRKKEKLMKSLPEDERRLADIDNNIKNAKKIVESQMAGYRSLSDFVKPGSPFMRHFDNAIQTLRDRAHEAASSTNPARQDTAKKLAHKADAIEADRAHFSALHQELEKRLSFLESQKPLIEDYYALNEGRKFHETAERVLSEFKDFVEEMKKSSDAVKQHLFQTTPTQ